MKYRFLLPGLIVLVFVLAACAPPANLRNDKFLKDDSLLSKDPCDAPCWRNITPGETKWSDALTILEDSPDIDKPEVQQLEDNGPAVGAQWQPKDGEPCCQIISEDGETVSFILLRLAPTNTLGKLIEARGEPKYIVGLPLTEDQASAVVLYPESSLMVVVFVAGDKTGQVSEDSELIAAYYLNPDQMDLILKTTALYAWNGYQSFSVYATDAPNADFAITPSVTLTPAPSQ